MKKIIYFFVSIIFSTKALAQTPQIALVNPATGNTQIFTTFDGAYNAAQNDDYIYLPGGTFSSPTSIDKRLNIYGAGYHPTESLVTGKTTIIGQFTLGDGASGSHVEGIDFTDNSSSSAFNLSGCSNITILNCKINGISSQQSSINCFFKNNIISRIVLHNSTFVNNIVLSSTNNYFMSCTIKNNAFLNTYEFEGSVAVLIVQNSNIHNNIFLSNIPVFNSGVFQNCGNIFLNNLKVGNLPLIYNGICSTNPSTESGTIHVNSIDDIFINYPSSAVPTFGFNYDYHLKTTSLGVSAGTDGTDVGIYGSSSPCPNVRIPSNPHIYLKNVGTQSTSDGKLQVHYGVKKGSQ